MVVGAVVWGVLWVLGVVLGGVHAGVIAGGRFGCGVGEVLGGLCGKKKRKNAGRLTAMVFLTEAAFGKLCCWMATKW